MLRKYYSIKYHFKDTPCTNIFKSVRLKFIMFICLYAGTLLTIYYICVVRNSQVGIIMDISENYFQSALELSQGVLLVDTANCQIPNLPEWTPDVLKLLKRVPPSKCNSSINLTYVENQNVIINQDALNKLGYDMTDISCCYHTIERVEQTLNEYDSDADNRWRYSNSCYPIKNRVTRPISGFIKITCNATRLFFWNKIIYQNLHLVAGFSYDNMATNLSRKLEKWESCLNSSNNEPFCKNVKKHGRPSNVLLIGIDSTSRLNFHRFMKNTMKMLNSLGAVELNGYTKVGENTYPNIIPLLTSYSAKELEAICVPNEWSSFDNCPFIWKNFSNQGYLIAYLEDSPSISIMNYFKTGFVQQPTDIYLRPWMLAAYTENSKDKHAPFSIDCIGYQRPEEIVLNYIVDLITLSESYSIPYFVTTWLTDLTHDDMNNVQKLDSVLAKTLLKLNMNGMLNNTVLIVMSDHGYRYGGIRSTTSGWFEVKLPAMYIKLTDKINMERPAWLHALQYNSKFSLLSQLTTPFNVHTTLVDILRLNSPLEGATKKFTRNLSLFQKLPSRSCDNAGIPEEYCPCAPPNTSASLNLTLVKAAAMEIVHIINEKLPRQCTHLLLSKITGALAVNEFRNETLVSADYSISFETMPGEFRFEAVITMFSVTGTASFVSKVSNVQRINKKTIETFCLSEQEISYELFCYCGKP